MQNVVRPTLVAMTTKFGLGAEIQSPTGLFVCHLLQSVVGFTAVEWFNINNYHTDILLLCLYIVSEHNTLYLEVHCPVVRPDVVIISNNGQTLTDFGQVSVGQRVVKSVTVQNISDHAVDVSLLDYTQLYFYSRKHIYYPACLPLFIPKTLLSISYLAFV